MKSGHRSIFYIYDVFRTALLAASGFLVCFHSAAAEPVPQKRQSAILPAAELTMTGYQTAQFELDLPIKTMAIDSSGVAWLAGRTSVWRWDAAGNSLQRIGLMGAVGEAHAKKNNVDHGLQILGNDGVSLFAATGDRLFQIQGEPRRVLLYAAELPTGHRRSLGFVGQGDSFWWLTAGGVFRFDRYGKRLVRAPRALKLLESDAAALDPASMRLWVARGAKLVSLDMSSTDGKATEIVNTSSPILGVQFVNGELFAWTARAFMRFDATGRRKQTIPVEGNRALHSIVLSPSLHSFLFRDGLLEMFDLQRQTTSRYHLANVASVDSGSTAARAKARAGLAGLAIGGEGLIGLVANGRPRLFRLPRENSEKKH